MPTETVHFENPRLAQQLFNHEPRNLQALEAELAVKAVAREDWIKLEGAVEDIARAKEMFHLLEKSLKGGRGGAQPRVCPGPQRGEK
jgi:phosphate starvation-inducible protein PhoH